MNFLEPSSDPRQRHSGDVRGAGTATHGDCSTLIALLLPHIRKALLAAALFAVGLGGFVALLSL